MRRHLLPILLVLSAGCSTPKIARHPVELVAKAEGQNHATQSHVNQAKPHTDKTGLAHLNSATDQLRQQGKTFLDLRSLLHQQQKQCADSERELKELQGEWFVRLVRGAETAWKIGVGTIIGAVILRVFSLLLLGRFPFASKIMGMAANGVFHVLTLGLTWMTSRWDIAEKTRNGAK